MTSIPDGFDGRPTLDQSVFDEAVRGGQIERLMNWFTQSRDEFLEAYKMLSDARKEYVRTKMIAYVQEAQAKAPNKREVVIGGMVLSGLVVVSLVVALAAEPVKNFVASNFSPEDVPTQPAGTLATDTVAAVAGVSPIIQIPQSPTVTAPAMVETEPVAQIAVEPALVTDQRGQFEGTTSDQVAAAMRLEDQSRIVEEKRETAPFNFVEEDAAHAVEFPVAADLEEVTTGNKSLLEDTARAIFLEQGVALSGDRIEDITAAYERIAEISENSLRLPELTKDDTALMQVLYNSGNTLEDPVLTTMVQQMLPTSYGVTVEAALGTTPDWGNGTTAALLLAIKSCELDISSFCSSLDSFETITSDPAMLAALGTYLNSNYALYTDVQAPVTGEYNDAMKAALLPAIIAEFQVAGEYFSFSPALLAELEKIVASGEVELATTKPVSDDVMAVLADPEVEPVKTTLTFGSNFVPTESSSDNFASGADLAFSNVSGQVAETLSADAFSVYQEPVVYAPVDDSGIQTTAPAAPMASPLVIEAVGMTVTPEKEVELAAIFSKMPAAPLAFEPLDIDTTSAVAPVKVVPEAVVAEEVGASSEAVETIDVISQIGQLTNGQAYVLNADGSLNMERGALDVMVNGSSNFNTSVNLEPGSQVVIRVEQGGAVYFVGYEIVALANGGVDIDTSTQEVIHQQ